MISAEAGTPSTLPRQRGLDPLLSLEAFSPPPTHTGRGPLHSGSTWAGVQRSGRNSYEVTVKFDESSLRSLSLAAEKQDPPG